MKSTKTKAKSKSVLPAWDLSALIAKPVDANIEKLLKQSDKDASGFQKTYAGKLGGLSASAFGKAIQRYEAMNDVLQRVYSYAFLYRQTRLDDVKAGVLYQSVMEKVNDISAKTLFFSLEINRIDDKKLNGFLKDKTVAHFKSWLDCVRASKPYQLSDEIEKTLHDRAVTGASAWIRLYDETVTKLRFPYRGKLLTETEIFHHMTSRDAEDRKLAAASIEKVFGDNVQTFAFILNTLCKEKEVDDRQRGFKTPAASRHLENQVEEKTVHALVSSVEGRYKDLSHRYYGLKAGWMGKKKMPYWDRNAPLPFSSARKISWAEAKEIILKAYGDFHPDMAKIAKRFFDENWIDAAPKAGKDSGAFSMSTIENAHPYILMNYKEGVEDVMTLAHELGHGVHQVLAAPQGALMADTPLTLAETASVFGEMLTFRSMLAAEKNPLYRKAMLAKKTEDMLNTVVRQISFHAFETKVHTARKTGELTPDEIGKIWMDVSKQSLGPAFEFTKGYQNFWTYISHFYHAPFYVYAYAFGDCLVNALYGVYQDSEKGFADKYLDLLRAGGTKRHGELLAPFGLDASKQDFWHKGLDVIESFIEQLETFENAGSVSGRQKKMAA